MDGWLGRVDAEDHLVDLLPAKRLLVSSKQLLSGATTGKMTQEQYQDSISSAPVYPWFPRPEISLLQEV